MKVRKIVLGIGVLISVITFSCSKQNTDTKERFYFRNDGADIAVQIDGNIGSKTFILVLHGGPGGGSAAYNAGYYSDELEKKYAMVYMDQRGNGASQGSYDKSDLTLVQNSKDVYALTLFLKQKYGKDVSIFLMGHSWGGITSAHALIDTEIQSELKGWIEVDGAHDFPMNDVEAVKLFLKIGTEQILLSKNIDFWQPIIDKVILMDTNNITSDDQGFLNSNGFKAESKLDEIVSGIAGSGPAYGLVNSPDFSLATYLSNQSVNPPLNEDSQKTPLTDQLYKIKIPSQFLWGKYDFVVPPAIGVSGFNNVGAMHKELIIFEHSGHSPMSNEPEKFVNSVVNFIELYK
jgi:pimeloyl-ACP methyl ester carboxylesterase